MLLEHYQALLLDLDGTVYRGDAAVPGAVYAVRAAREHGRAVRFVTNNASRGPDEVAAQLNELGFDTGAAEIQTSAQAAAALLRARLDQGARVLVVGSESLGAEVAAVGLEPVRDGCPQPAAVVQGLAKDVGWPQLAEACVAIRGGALWVACNVDPTLPTERGQLPGNGALVAALCTATGARPEIAGKPGRPLLEEAVASVDGPALVVGDRLDTDIAGARATGLDSLLVLSGVSSAADLLAAPEIARPTYLAADLRALTESAGSARIGPRPGWTVTVDGRVDGDGATVELLRALCDVAWRHPGLAPRGADGPARAALAELGLG